MQVPSQAPRLDARRSATRSARWSTHPAGLADALGLAVETRGRGQADLRGRTQERRTGSSAASKAAHVALALPVRAPRWVTAPVDLARTDTRRRNPPAGGDERRVSSRPETWRKLEREVAAGPERAGPWRGARSRTARRLPGAARGTIAGGVREGDGGRLSSCGPTPSDHMSSAPFGPIPEARRPSRATRRQWSSPLARLAHRLTSKLNLVLARRWCYSRIVGQPRFGD